jgi:MFS transporter, DHA3 family, macrolide efflux protein
MVEASKTDSLIKLPNFRRLFIAGSTSELGSFITETVIMLFIFKITNNNKSSLGLLRSSFLISLTLGSIIGGPLGEFINRKKILIWCELLRVPLILSLIWYRPLHWIIITNSLIAFFTGVFRPSKQALVNEVVPNHQIPSANSLFGSTNAIFSLIGPFLGATLFAFFGGIKEVLFFDLLTYFLGIFLLFKIKYTPFSDSDATPNQSFIREIALGISYIKNRGELLAIIINTSTVGLCIGLLIPLLVPYVIEVLGGTETQYGILMSSFGLGGLIGSMTTRKLMKYLPNGKIPFVSIIIEPILFAGFLLFHNYYASVFFFFLWGIVVFLRITSQMNFISHSVDTKYLSRVHSLIELSFIAPNIIGGIFISYFGDQYSTESILIYSMYAFAIIIYLRAPMKHMRNLWKVEPAQVKRHIQT